ncbi:MAG: PstS family phosphate ABC transporter substrate-binding protein [Planctomycetaceae bacterium]|nr:PstS family phosphate ABC transporter substrate-binding protein [Planctomycetaceae bacterium]
MRALMTSFCLSLLIASTFHSPASGAENELESYKTVSGVSGNLNSIGSDTLNNLMTFWAEDFRKLYPNVNVQIEGKGSATAPQALTNGTAQLGPMSRAMKPEEEEAFEQKYGFRPTRVSVALDCLAVYVHRDNPIAGLSLGQIDGIFSKTRKSGHEDVATWGQLGLTGNWASRPISIYGRNSASGTYAFFKEHALSKGDFKDTVKEQPGTAAVVNGVANDRAGIGYGGIGYVTSEIRAVPLAKADGQSPVEPSFENALSGKYPLGRALYIYVAKKPGEPLSPLVEEFLKFVLSKQGQEIVVKDGYGPLPAAAAAKQRKVISQ